MQIKAVIFDFDGVIVDTPKISFLAWKESFKRAGIDFTREEYLKYQGIRSQDKIPIILKSHGKYTKELSDELLKYREGLKRSILKMVSKEDIEIPGAIDFLKSLKNKKLKLALITSSLRDTASVLLEKMDIKKCFDITIFGDDVMKGKPDPEIFLTAAKKLGVKPDKCLVFEDVVNGVKACRTACMNVIAVNTNQIKEDLEKEKPLFVIEDFKDKRLEKLI